MFDRRNQILTILLVVQIALAAFLFWPKTTVSGGGSSLLPDLEPDDVVAMTIKAGENEKETIAFAKEGDTWVLADADSYPANGEKIEQTIEKLAKVNTSRLVTQTDASHSRLEVAEDKFNRMIQLESKGGDKYDVFVGTSAGGNSTHIRAGGQSQVYLTNEVASWDLNAQPSGWVDTKYFTVPTTGTVKMSLTNANGTFSFVKDDTGWQMADLAEGEQLNQDNVVAFYEQARSVSLSAPIGKTEKPEFGLGAPSAVVTVTTSSEGQERTYTLTIGAAQADETSDQATAKTYVAKSSESPYYVRLAAYTGSTFAEKKKADFLQTASEAGE